MYHITHHTLHITNTNVWTGTRCCCSCENISNPFTTYLGSWLIMKKLVPAVSWQSTNLRSWFAVRCATCEVLPLSLEISVNLPKHPLSDLSGFWDSNESASEGGRMRVRTKSQQSQKSQKSQNQKKRKVKKTCKYKYTRKIWFGFLQHFYNFYIILLCILYISIYPSYIPSIIHI